MGPKRITGRELANLGGVPIDELALLAEKPTRSSKRKLTELLLDGDEAFAPPSASESREVGDSANETTKGVEDSETNSPPVVRRGRGRPPKEPKSQEKVVSPSKEAIKATLEPEDNVRNRQSDSKTTPTSMGVSRIKKKRIAEADSDDDNFDREKPFTLSLLAAAPINSASSSKQTVPAAKPTVSTGNTRSAPPPSRQIQHPLQSSATLPSVSTLEDAKASSQQSATENSSQPAPNLVFAPLPQPVASTTRIAKKKRHADAPVDIESIEESKLPPREQWTKQLEERVERSHVLQTGRYASSTDIEHDIKEMGPEVERLYFYLKKQRSGLGSSTSQDSNPLLSMQGGSFLGEVNRTHRKRCLDRPIDPLPSPYGIASAVSYGEDDADNDGEDELNSLHFAWRAAAALKDPLILQTPTTQSFLQRHKPMTVTDACHWWGIRDGVQMDAEIALKARREQAALEAEQNHLRLQKQLQEQQALATLEKQKQQQLHQQLLEARMPPPPRPPVPMSHSLGKGRGAGRDGDQHGRGVGAPNSNSKSQNQPSTFGSSIQLPVHQAPILIVPPTTMYPSQYPPPPQYPPQHPPQYPPQRPPQYPPQYPSHKPPHIRESLSQGPTQQEYRGVVSTYQGPSDQSDYQPPQYGYGTVSLNNTAPHSSYVTSNSRAEAGSSHISSSTLSQSLGEATTYTQHHRPQRASSHGLPSPPPISSAEFNGNEQDDTAQLLAAMGTAASTVATTLTNTSKDTEDGLQRHVNSDDSDHDNLEDDDTHNRSHDGSRRSGNRDRREHRRDDHDRYHRNDEKSKKDKKHHHSKQSSRHESRSKDRDKRHDSRDRIHRDSRDRNRDRNKDNHQNGRDNRNKDNHGDHSSSKNPSEYRRRDDSRDRGGGYSTTGRKQPSYDKGRDSKYDSNGRGRDTDRYGNAGDHRGRSRDRR